MRYSSAHELGPGDVGRRVTVRRRLPDGGLGDVIGVLESIDDDTAVLLDRRGARIRIELADVTASRVVGE